MHNSVPLFFVVAYNQLKIREKVPRFIKKSIVMMNKTMWRYNNTLILSDCFH